MVMRAFVLLFAVLSMVQMAKSAPRFVHIEQPPDKEISYKAIDCRLDSPARGVLILVPGVNGDGKKFLSENPWTQFAEQNRLAFVGVSFKSPRRLLKCRNGYYVSSRGSGRELLTLLKKAGLSELPLLMFGFSGGANFVSSFVEEYPDRVLAWCAQSATGLADDKRSTAGVPPGIVACGGEDARLGATLSYFKRGRAAGRCLSWVELPHVGHARNVAFEEFVREYFEEILLHGKRGGPIWVDLGNGEAIKGTSDCAEANRSWMPSERIYGLWHQLITSNNVPIITRRVQTHSALQRQLTIFLRRSKVTPAKGVLCLCVLANRPSDIKWRMLTASPRNEMGRLASFAETNNLALIVWGSRKGLWNPRLNWSELEWNERKKLDKEFDHVAAAWETAVLQLSRTYGFPQNGYLLWGYSGAAQYAQRLALRKPYFFRAIHIHVASSYDIPVPEGRNMQWCVTTGENENGYERSLRFLAEARRNGYPMIYKAYPGVGHAGCRAAETLGLECYHLALKHTAGNSEWNRLFIDPAYWGDVVNQTIWEKTDVNMIPLPFRTALPTEDITVAWSRQ